MKLLSLTLSGYRQYFETTLLEIPSGLIGICGPNGVGKSKLIEAIGYALYGPVSAILPRADRVSDLASKAGRAIPQVELALEIRGQHYVIVRTTQGRTSIRFDGANDALADGATAVTQKVVELIGLNAAAFCGTFVARQNEVTGLQSLAPHERRQLVNRLIGITQVEHAIQLAKEKKAAQAESLKLAKAKLSVPSSDAQQRLELLHTEHLVAIERRETQQKEVESLTRTLQAAQATLETLARRNEQVGLYQQKIEELAPTEAAASRRVQSAEERQAKALVAGDKVTEAETTIHQTEEIPLRLAHYDLLAKREAAMQQQHGLAGQLAERIALEAKMAELDVAIETLSSTIRKHETNAIQAEAEANQACLDAERQEQQRNTVQQLGRDGICDVCGQVLGDNYQHALQRHTHEAAESRRREQDCNARAQKARENAKSLDLDRSAKQQLRKKLAQRHKVLEAVPGQVEVVRATLAGLDLQLVDAPPGLYKLVYSALEHADLRLSMERREDALRTANEQRALAAQVIEVEQEVREARRALQELQRQHANYEAQIIATAPSDEEMAAATAILKEARDVYKRANKTLDELRDAVVRMDERIRLAVEEIEKAKTQEQQITIAERNQFIAEQAELALQRLLIEITGEARPRIVELMETWMRALLGPRFRTIELTDDYQLKADNGSGLHPITHFSGGEQTLLAIMLRVAISIFCRERAGFETSFLILDEVFGNQDAEHRQQLIDFLNEIKGHYHQILIVNHIEDVTAMLDNIIEIRPTGNNTSKPQLR